MRFKHDDQNTLWAVANDIAREGFANQARELRRIGDAIAKINFERDKAELDKARRRLRCEFWLLVLMGCAIVSWGVYASWSWIIWHWVLR